MLFRRPSRPFDPTAKSIQNYIIAEIRPLDKDQKYIFVPSHGPFYSESLVVRNGNRVLTLNKDYQVLILHKEATMDTGKEVGVCIRVLDETLPTISISYQAVGGKYNDLVGVLRSIREGFGSRLLKPIKYVDIVGKPTSFNPSAHWHSMWEFSGWETLINDLDGVRNAVIRIDKSKYSEVTDYLAAEFAAVNSDLIRLSQNVRTELNKLRQDILPQPGNIRLSTKNTTFKDGTWDMQTVDTLLYAVNLNADIGKTWKLSKDPVLPYPDNVILDENDTYLLRDDEEWIFRDNEFPAVNGGGGGEDYWEEIDEQFDALTVRMYKLANLNPTYSLIIESDKTRITDNEVVVFKINTEGFPPNTTFPYQMSGIIAENVNVPLYGTVTTNATGVATLAVKLLPNVISYPFESDIGKIKLMVGIGLQQKYLEVEYVFNTTPVPKVDIYYTQGLNDLIKMTQVQNDDFKLKIRHDDIVNTTYFICSNVPNGIAYTVDGINAPTTPGRKVSVNAAYLYHPIKLGVNNAVGRADISFWVEVDGVEYGRKANVLEPRSFTFEFIDTNGRVVTEVKSGQRFKLRIKHVGVHTTPFSINVSATSISDKLEPANIPPVYTDSSNTGSTDYLVVNTPTDGLIDLVITGDTNFQSIRKTLQIKGV